MRLSQEHGNRNTDLENIATYFHTDKDENHTSPLCVYLEHTSHLRRQKHKHKLNGTPALIVSDQNSTKSAVSKPVSLVKL